MESLLSYVEILKRHSCKCGATPVVVDVALWMASALEVSWKSTPPVVITLVLIKDVTDWAEDGPSVEITGDSKIPMVKAPVCHLITVFSLFLIPRSVAIPDVPQVIHPAQKKVVVKFQCRRSPAKTSR